MKFRKCSTSNGKKGYEVTVRDVITKKVGNAPSFSTRSSASGTAWSSGGVRDGVAPVRDGTVLLDASGNKKADDRGHGHRPFRVPLRRTELDASTRSGRVVGADGVDEARRVFLHTVHRRIVRSRRSIGNPPCSFERHRRDPDQRLHREQSAQLHLRREQCQPASREA
jgi:hypothetical protein